MVDYGTFLHLIHHEIYDTTISMIYYLALGSNMGNKPNNLQKAIEFLQTLGVLLDASSIYKTSPVGMEENTDNFFNMVVSLESTHDPQQLLKEIKKFEQSMGRDPIHSHNTPRTIDIDILLAENQELITDHLVIPHKEMCNRGFVLVPLNEIAPDVIHPVRNRKINDLLSQLKTNETIEKTLPPPLRPFKHGHEASRNDTNK